MNDNINVKEYQFNTPIIHKIESLIDNSIKDCQTKCFHTFDHICEDDNLFKNITNNETVNFVICDKNMSLYELIKKVKMARENGFILKLLNKLTKKIYSNLSHVNIQ